jgi:hypothetical protein
MKHFYNNGLEYIRKEPDYQGRSERQIISNYKITFFSIIGLILTIFFIFLLK